MYPFLNFHTLWSQNVSYLLFGVDKDSGLVHSVEVTSANVHDVPVVPELLTGEETIVYGDSGYLGAEKPEDAVVTETNSLQGQPPSLSKQTSFCTLPGTDQTPGTGEVFHTSKSGTGLWCCEGSASIPENPIPRSAKTDCKTEYHVRIGESDSG